MFKIFLSSTFRDLKKHREKVLAALRRQDGVATLAMEDWTAYPDQPKDVCLAKVAEADAVVLILGHLYGHVPDGDDISITQAEYEQALALKKPVLAFLASNEVLVSVALLRADKNLDKQDALRERVRKKHTPDDRWVTPEELAERVANAVSNERQRQNPEVQARLAGLAAIRFDFEQYARRARKRWNRLDLTSMAMGGAMDEDMERATLTDLFIPQDCRRSRPPAPLPREYMEELGMDAEAEAAQFEVLQQQWDREERLPALDLMGRNDAGQLILLGDPGAGKSSLMSYALLELLDGYTRSPDQLTDWRKPLHGRLPLLIELRDLVAREAEDRCSGLFSYLVYLGKKQGYGFDEQTLRAQLDAHPSLLLIDGLDEIFDTTRRGAMQEEIIGLQGLFPKARVVVTSRIAGFSAKSFEDAGFTIATLDDLDEDQIAAFADGWFARIFPDDPDRAVRTKEKLLKTLRRRPQLRTVAGNPLLLTIMGIVARHKELARSRAKLYAQALEVLCYQWDYRKGLKLAPDSPLADLQAEDTLLMLRRIAWHMQESDSGLRANALTKMALLGVLRTYFAEEWQYPPPKANRAAMEMVRLLQERNWILTIHGPNLFGFIHRTFLEYLCAVELATRFQDQEMDATALITYAVPRIEDDAWREVGRLLCGALPHQTAAQFIDAVLTADEEVIERSMRLRIGWQLIAEVEPRSLQQVTATCRRLMDALYAFLEEGYDSSDAATNDLLESIASIDEGFWPNNDVEERGWATPSPELPWTFPQVIAVSSKHLWSNERAAVTLLQGFATDDTSSSVRRQAISSLASHFTDRSEVYPLLQGFATDDTSFSVRRQAISSLASHFTDRSEVYPLLQGFATDDADAVVRKAALLGLATAKGSALQRTLASRYLNVFTPGLDPREAVTADFVQKAATRFNMTPAAIRAEYERMVDELELPLRLAWREEAGVD